MATRVSSRLFSHVSGIHRRRFHASIHVKNQKSIPHKDLAYLHFHPISSGQPSATSKYALSYLSSNDVPSGKSLKDHSELVIGWSPETTLEPRTFVDNAAFVDFMTNVLKENIHRVNDPVLKSLAEWQKEGWMHIADERDPPAWGRIPFPEDIVGTVLVKDGVIQPNTYQAMPAHRLVTAHGIFQLPESLTKVLIDAAKKRIK